MAEQALIKQKKNMQKDVKPEMKPENLFILDKSEFKR